MIDTSTGYSDGTNVVRHLPFTATSQTRFIARIPGENYIQLLFYTTVDSGAATATWTPAVTPSATGFGSSATQTVNWGAGAPNSVTKTLVRATWSWASLASTTMGRLSFTLSGVTLTGDMQVITYRNFVPEGVMAGTIYVAT